MPAAPMRAAQPARLLSLDVFRGGTIAAMILVNNPGSSAIYPQLRHADWHGWTLTDLVFPFFLWIAGVSINFSFARRVERGDSRAGLLLHIVRRAGLIFLLGLLLNGFPYYHLPTLRIPGVLQRIAICYLIAAAIFLYTGTRGRVIWTAALLAIYWALMKLAPVPGYGRGILEKDGNFQQYVDGLFLSGHMYSQTRTWDPEGIVSTLPAIATVLFGILAGQMLRSRMQAAEKAVWMLITGNTLILAGLLMSGWLPINKSIWTSSYSAFTAGIAFVVFASAYWLVDVLGWKRGTKPLEIYGMNAIAAYVLSGIVARLLSLTGLKPEIYNSVFGPAASPVNASLLYAIANVLVIFLFVWLLYRRGWFIRV